MNGIQILLNQYKDTKINEQTKIREILQQAALLGLQRHGFFAKGAFYGGTALRILYGLDRFSEDLDFTLIKADPSFDFTPFLEGMRRELKGFGFEMDVAVKTKTVETSVISAFMKMNTIQLYLSIGDEKKSKSLNHNEKIQIKLEIDTDPPCPFLLKNHLVTNPLPFYVVTLDLSDLFSGKMHAILYRAWKTRVKGRDWYDLIWYIQNNVPLNISCLKAYMHQAGHLEKDASFNREKLISKLQEKIKVIDWEQAKTDIVPFISDPDRLTIWSSQFFLDLINYLKVKEG